MTPLTLPVEVFLIIKSLVILGLALYTIFSWVLVRQEQLMSSVLEEHFQPVLRLLVIIHGVASVILLLLAFVLLRR